MKRQIHWVSSSSDKKIGKVLASYSPYESCPDSCSLKTGGCYAWGLFYLRNLGKKIRDGVLCKTLDEALIKKHKDAKIVRHRVAGDVVGDQEGTYNECKTVERNGLINIGYTHDWASDSTQVLKEYFRASCNNLDELIEAREKGWGVTIIVPKGTPNRVTLSNGETAIMCPVIKEEKKIDIKLDSMSFENKRQRSAKKSEMKKNIKMNCNLCTLCKINDKTRAKAVMFEVHGSPQTLRLAEDKYEDVSG